MRLRHGPGGQRAKSAGRIARCHLAAGELELGRSAETKVRDSPHRAVFPIAQREHADSGRRTLSVAGEK